MTAPRQVQTGAGNFEGMCGVLGALEYIQWVGETYGDDLLSAMQPILPVDA